MWKRGCGCSNQVHFCGFQPENDGHLWHLAPSDAHCARSASIQEHFRYVVHL